MHQFVIFLAHDWLQVEKAESVLLEIKRLIDKQVETLPEQFQAEVSRLSDDFYTHLPHDNKQRVIIDSKRRIANKQQLCQVSSNIFLFIMITIKGAITLARIIFVRMYSEVFKQHLSFHYDHH